MEKIIKRGLKSLRFLIKWIIKMAKKLLNLDTTNGALSFEDSESLPSGTTNQTLRHNGTDWVANDRLQIGTTISGTSTGFKASISGTGVDEFRIEKSDGSSSNRYLFRIYDSGLSFGTGGATYFTCKYLSSSTSEFVVSTTSAKINYLAGTGDRPVYADSNGVLKIGTNPSLTGYGKTKIINRVLTSASSIHSFNNTDLGITGDLTAKIISFELLRKTGANDYFSLGELVQTDKTITIGAVTFATGEIPIGDTIRLAITYTD